MTTLKKVGSVSAESVKKHTKKNWDNWLTTLNQRACQNWSHQELVALLKKEFRLTPWWQQEVARGYQIAIGVRIPQQTLKGTYTTTATKTLTESPKKIFAFLLSLEGQKIWLQAMGPVPIKKGQAFECEGGIFGEFRSVSINKLLRFTWVDEDWPRKSVVQIHLYPKAKAKTMIVVDHTDLPTIKAKTLMHARWRKVVEGISEAFS